MWARVTQVALLVVALLGPNLTASSAAQYLGPLACTDPTCPTAQGGRTPNNTNFHLRDVAVTAGPDGW